MTTSHHLLSALALTLISFSVTATEVTGTLLQNSAPGNVPTDAVFRVPENFGIELLNPGFGIGPGTEAETTIRQLNLSTSSGIHVRNDLTITSGIIDVRSGRASYSGFLPNPENTLRKTGEGALVFNPYYTIGSSVEYVQTSPLNIDVEDGSFDISVLSGKIVDIGTVNMRGDRFEMSNWAQNIDTLNLYAGIFQSSFVQLNIETLVIHEGAEYLTSGRTFANQVFIDGGYSFGNFYAYGNDRTFVLQRGTLVTTYVGQYHTKISPDGRIIQNPNFPGRLGLDGWVINSGNIQLTGPSSTLWVGRAFTQTRSGTLHIPLTADHLGRNASWNDSFTPPIVADQVQLSGELRLYALPALSFGQSYQVLSAFGGLSGQFTNITGLPSGFRARQWVSGNGTQLNIVFAPSSYTLVAASEEQAAFAAALDQWIGSNDPKVQQATFQLDQLTAEEYPMVFEQALPRIYPLFPIGSLENAYRDGRSVLREARSGSLRVPQTEDTDAPGWRVWTDLRGGYETTDVFSIDEDSGTLLFGVDVPVGDGLVGVYLGGQERDLENSGSFTNNGDGARFGVYGSLPLGETGYVSAVIGGGQTEFESIERSLPFEGQATATPEVNDFFTSIEIGTTKRAESFNLTPFAGITFSQSTLNAFTETSESVFAISTEDMDVSRIDGIAGLRVSAPIVLKNQQELHPFVHTLYRMALDEDADPLTSRLQGAGQPSFDYETTLPDNDGVEAGAGIQWVHPDSGWSTLLAYTGFWGEDSDSHFVNLGVSFVK